MTGAVAVCLLLAILTVAAALASGLRLTTMLGAIAAAVLLLAPLAVYFALSRE